MRPYSILHTLYSIPRRSSAFTLIELLVVISIISLLSSVILASLSVAREKGRIASVILFADHNYHAFGADAIGYWNFDEGSDGLGSLPAQDLSGHNRTMVAVGTVNRENSTTPTGSGYALLLVSLNSGYAKANNVSGTDLQPTNMTVSAWVEFYSLTNTNSTLLSVKASSLVDFEISINEMRNYYGCMSQMLKLTTPIITFGSLDTGKWHHIACSVSPSGSGGGMITAYYDGKQIAQSPAADYPTVADYPSGYPSISLITINGNSEYIDDVAIYSSGLTASQIHEIYAEQAPKHQYAANVK